MTLRCIIGLVSFNRERERDSERGRERERETERDKKRHRETKRDTESKRARGRVRGSE